MCDARLALATLEGAALPPSSTQETGLLVKMSRHWYAVANGILYEYTPCKVGTGGSSKHWPPGDCIEALWTPSRAALDRTDGGRVRSHPLDTVPGTASGGWVRSCAGAGLAPCSIP